MNDIETIEYAAEYLKITIQTARRMAVRGTLGGVFRPEGSRSWRVHLPTFHRAIEEAVEFPKAPRQAPRLQHVASSRGRKAVTPVFKRPKSEFWHIRYTNAEGVEIRRSSQTKDFAEAQALYRLYTGQAGALSIDSLVNRFFREHEMRPKTLACYQTSYKTWKPFVGHLNVSDFTMDHAKQFMSTRRMEVKSGTIRNDLAFMSSFLSFACMLPGGPSKNILGDMDKRQLKYAKPRVRFLAPDQLTSLLKELTEPYERLVALFGLDAGLRRNEILRLKVRQADPRRRKIILYAGETKSGLGRVVPMTNRLTRELISWLRAHPSLQPGEWLITNPGTLKPYTEMRWWNRACERAGIKDFTFHDTRHHFASNFVQRGGRLQPLAALLGHSTIAMSEKYAHLATGDAAKEFRQVMGGRRS